MPDTYVANVRAKAGTGERINQSIMRQELTWRPIAAASSVSSGLQKLRSLCSSDTVLLGEGTRA